MNRQSILKTVCLLAVTLFTVACTNEDDLADGKPEALPEGMYPLQIASVSTVVDGGEAEPWAAAAPQTRVSENTAGTGSVWNWNGAEQIGVQLGNKTAIYTLNSNKTITTGTPIYWTNTSEANITAWYPLAETVNLANQSGGLAYVLKGTGKGSYKRAASLTFSHSLSKVRVVFSNKSTVDVMNASVSILAPTSCTNDKGKVTAGGTTTYIPMCKKVYNGNVCYEANVTPNLMLGQDAFQLNIGGTMVKCSTSSVTTQAAQVHIITLTINKEKVVNVSDISETGYTVSGNVLLKGNGTSKNLSLTVKSGAKLTLENVNLTPGNFVITCEDDATIILKGTNILSAQGEESWKKGIAINKGTLVIQGDGTLTVTAYGVGIGANNGANITINSGKITATCTGESAGIGSNIGETCGTITINGGIIEAHGGRYSAGIGSGNSGTCGDIFITGGDIAAYGGAQVAGIGNGDYGVCGNITISGPNTVVYAKKGPGLNPSSIGYNNNSGSCGVVTIGDECKVKQE